MVYEPAVGEVVFYALTKKEHNHSASAGVEPHHLTYVCGSCGNTTNGRVVCEVKRHIDRATIFWCLCSCEKEEPTVILLDKTGMNATQFPLARLFHPGKDWPKDLADLYDEASKACAAGAYTAASMVCRKILMACACNKGDADGKKFADYVDYITGTVLTFPDAKAAIDKIRSIGNDANHEVKFVNQADAERAMRIVTYMLNTIYSFPVA